MAKPTQEQLQVADELAAAPEGGTDDIADAPPAPLSVMLGEGEPFRLGKKVYDLAPFALVNLKKGYALLNQCPAILTAQAFAVKDGEPLLVEALTEAYNAIMSAGQPVDPEKPDGDKRPTYTVQEIADILGNLPTLLTNAEPPKDAPSTWTVFDPMLDLIVLTLSRRHPEITRADIELEIDFANFVRFVRCLSRVNTGLAQSF